MEGRRLEDMRSPIISNPHPSLRSLIEVELSVTMLKLPLALVALCGALALSACANNESTSSASPSGDAANAGAAANNSATPAVGTPEPDYPQPAVVVPPRPKPGAPHGPGFDMPLIELGGYTPSRPMDVLRDAHMFAADHPEVASYVPCYCGCGSAGHKNNADCFVKGARSRGPRHRMGAARRGVRRLHRHRRRFDEDEELRRVGDGDSQESAERVPAEFSEQRNADAGTASR